MAREPLSPAEILRAEEALREAFRSISKIREHYGEAGALVQFPKIPPLIAESVVFWMLNGRPELASLGFRQAGRDMIGLTRTGEEVPIEVKSTGASAFQHLSQKDITSKWLIWMHFQRYFQDVDDPITIYAFEDIGKEFSLPRRVTLGRLLQRVPQDRQSILLQGETVSDVLSQIRMPQTDLANFLRLKPAPGKGGVDH